MDLLGGARRRNPVQWFAFGVICLAIVVSAAISLAIVFPSDPDHRPFCSGLRLQPLPINASEVEDLDSSSGALYLTDQGTVDYYFLMLFLPSLLVFLASVTYLVAGVLVAYSAPRRHGCLRVVENNSCASNRGGIHCLMILNAVFALIFGLLALFLGSSLLSLGSRCALPLFWCYEIASWGLVILYGGTALILRKTAALTPNRGDFPGLEMLEANPLKFTPGMDARANESFRTWLGSSLLSSDEEDEQDDEYMGNGHRTGISRFLSATLRPV